MGKFIKRSGTAHCKFVKIKLGKKYTNKFRITFVRGKSMDRSDLVVPNENNELIFDLPFDPQCLFFVAHNKKVRRKNLKVVLHRFVSADTQKIFGEVDIDLGQYYYDAEPISKDFTMGSKHGAKPILTFECYVSRRRKARKHPERTHERVSLLEDRYLDSSTYEPYVQPSVKIKPAKGDPIESDSDFKSESSSPPPPPPEEPKPEPAAQPPPQPHLDSEEEEKKEAPEEEPKRQDSQGLLKVKSLVQKASAGITLSRMPKLRPGIADANRLDVPGIFRKLLTQPIPELIEVSFMDPDTQSGKFPSGLYPIYQTMLKSKLFTTSIDSDFFTESMNVFYELYPSAPLVEPCDTEQRFLTTLVLLLITNLHSAQYGFLPERTSDFFNHMLSLLNEYAREIIAPIILDFEALVNTFSTARFDVDDLLGRFNEAYDAALETFHFLPSVNLFLTKSLNNSLDAIMLNKILINPARFAFSRAVAWNSFLTACLTTKQLDFPLTRQCVTCLMMAVNIATDQSKEGDEDIRSSVCPDLDPNLIVYLLKNYKPDNMMEISINYRLIAQKLGVKDAVKYTPVKPAELNDFQFAGDNIRVAYWSMVKPDPKLVQEFPHLSTK
ncbi:hypothetical protein TRFO_27681 [Tritrichomonas foetus]|uniref:C2 NT-type domain-containing protein n=1 Tax=Tritrichomonas foetus TaxID=1144522 RepID=A0A1J4K4K6_9EUKA|nr:hypothetical protein TRFO_27681 [Tritrichomonas foetus]|eukprot:OHT04684.1 hypothetical protein TRFO_27681 [Tritrichomonas foetus]